MDRRDGTLVGVWRWVRAMKHPDLSEKKDPDARALRFVDLGVVGTLGQQPLAKQPARFFLNRPRLAQPPQRVAEPKQKGVP